MKINVTKKEYLTLLQAMDMIAWISRSVAADETDESIEKVAPYDALIQKVYGLAKDFGCGDLIDHDEVLDEFVLSEEFETTAEHREIISEFEDIAFWDTISSKLAVRDVVRILGQDQFENLDLLEQMTMISERKELWLDEFSEHGLERLDIKS